MNVETPTSAPGRVRGRVAGIGLLVTAAVAAAAAVVEPPHAAAGPPAAGDTNFGDPLPGLTADQLARFHAGKAAFEEVEGAADGLGPVFNGASCAECHNGEATGGGSGTLSTRIGAVVDGRFDPLVRFGGPTIQTKGILGLEGFEYAGEVVPPEATVVARRRSPPLFGLGLVDAVPDDAFRELARDQRDRHPDTAGRPNLVPDLRTGKRVVGRFGWKAGLGGLFDFAADAYKDEMGITAPGFVRTPDGRTIGEENAPQGRADLLRFNPAESPNEPDVEDIVLFTDFMTFLAPPPRGEVTARVRAGETVFRQIGCADCHVPTLRTGRHEVKALDRVKFHPYSDFLLHDMGALGDGIEDGRGRGSEMRTAPLWGLLTQPAYLHDGRAKTVEAAILLHDGQGRGARDRYRDLPPAKKRVLSAFLNSL
ncbi:MAG: hypothetical protein K2X82_21265 [Gemmataceae bacterium]|nr:hypothetical protein [Gemmataceae bacterium]